MTIEFEQVGWSHIDINKAAQQRVEMALRSAGARIESIDISSIIGSSDFGVIQ